MFARVFALLPLALLASASHLEARDQCNTGSISCCNQVQTAQQANQILSQYNLVAAAAAAGGNVGLTCTPVTVVGTGSGCDATQQPVCCTGNQFNGVVNIGCTPINVNA
ncbi:hydrophobin [Paxillus ammoniavirescens]|nr:hydrophobin [Paxillus ammoniavirescens]